MMAGAMPGFQSRFETYRDGDSSISCGGIVLAILAIAEEIEACDFTVTFRKVRGHQRLEGNKRADDLARRSMA